MVEQLKAYYQGLQPRERRLLLIGGGVVLFTLIYLLIWEPLASGKTQAQSRAEEQRELALWMENAAAEAKTLRGVNGGPAPSLQGQSMLSLVDSSAKAQKLGSAMKRVEPDGQEKVRVWFEGVSFDEMVGWLETLANRYGVRASSISVDRMDSPGVVNAKLLLEGGV